MRALFDAALSRRKDSACFENIGNLQYLNRRLERIRVEREVPRLSYRLDDTYSSQELACSYHSILRVLMYPVFDLETVH